MKRLIKSTMLLITLVGGVAATALLVNRNINDQETNIITGEIVESNNDAIIPEAPYNILDSINDSDGNGIEDIVIMDEDNTKSLDTWASGIDIDGDTIADGFVSVENELLVDKDSLVYSIDINGTSFKLIDINSNGSVDWLDTNNNETTEPEYTVITDLFNNYGFDKNNDGFVDIEVIYGETVIAAQIWDDTRHVIPIDTDNISGADSLIFNRNSTIKVM